MSERKNIITIEQPKDNEKWAALEAFLKALKINFNISNDESYSPKFVEKIETSRKQAKEGKSTRVKKEDLKEFLGL
ncbi:MAG: hypothetical protein H3C31_09055 [Brumimicrobium sp.]|nr:hypothetical protein [Brumimicrobium sp.]